MPWQDLNKDKVTINLNSITGNMICLCGEELEIIDSQAKCESCLRKYRILINLEIL